MDNYISVTELNHYIAVSMEGDPFLNNVFVEGELSNVKMSKNHYYFSIKDENSEISAMFFYPKNLSLNFKLADGIKVEVIGKVSLYEKRGTYAINVSKMTEAGVGIMYQKFIELKDELAKAGYFDASHKLPLPQYPRKVGVITAISGEAINDICSTFNKRFPLTSLVIFPSLVQGEEAPASLIASLNKAYLEKDLDAIIIGRGGGSFEDLNAFNDKELALTLFKSPIPTVSAVGHEGDYTICDFIASRRAPTPTGAAMMLSIDQKEVKTHLLNLVSRLNSSYKKHLSDYFYRFDQMNKLLLRLSPEVMAKARMDAVNNLSLRLGSAFDKNLSRFSEQSLSLSTSLASFDLKKVIEKESLNIENLTNKLAMLFSHQLEMEEKEYLALLEKLDLVNPLALISKGYAIVKKDGKVISKIKDLKSGEEIDITLQDGSVTAIIK